MGPLIYRFFFNKYYRATWIHECGLSDKEKESESYIAQLCGTLCNPMGWNSPGHNTGVGSLSFLQGIFPTQGSDPDLLHCGHIHYHLSHQIKKADYKVLCGSLIALESMHLTPTLYKSQPYCYDPNCKRSTIDRFSWQGEKHFMKPNTFLVTWNSSKIFLISAVPSTESKSQCIPHRSALKKQNNSTNEWWSYW